MNFISASRWSRFRVKSSSSGTRWECGGIPGLPGVGDAVEDVARHINDQIDQLDGVRRIVTVGPSMGAYGAILFGCLLGAERVIALAPQTYLSHHLQTEWLPEDLDLQVPDLAPIIREAPTTKIELVAGWDETIDVFHAQRVAGFQSVRVLALPGRTHFLAIELHREGKLEALIGDLLRGDTPADCQVNPPLDPEVEWRIEDTVLARVAGDWRAAAEKIAPVADRYRDWAGPNFDLGRGLIGTGDWAGAETPLRRAVVASPHLTEPRIALAAALSERKRSTDAETVLREGLAIDPDWKEGRLMLEGRFECQARWYLAGKEAASS